MPIPFCYECAELDLDKSKLHLPKGYDSNTWLRIETICIRGLITHSVKLLGLATTNQNVHNAALQIV